MPAEPLPPRARLLVVEDDEALAVALRDGFEHEGYAVTVVREGETALQVAARERPDLIVLDIMLPRLSGLGVCKELRRARDRTPLLFLTALGQEIDKVLGLKAGADDYVTKPFSFLELQARVEALLRRASPALASLDRLRFADIEVDFAALQARRGGEPLDLSPREHRLLKYLAEHRGEVVTRDQLLDAVWGYTHFPLTRTVDVHVARLRQKLGDDSANPRYILTVHRVGYRFVAEPIP
jgi:two-component system alkaline phosphatase synthesis response regulator PhoP